MISAFMTAGCDQPKEAAMNCRILEQRSAGRRDEGFSLVEVMAAMLVLALGVLGLAPMMMVSIVGNLDAEDVTRVTASVQREIEARLAAGVAGPMPIEEVATYDNGKYTVATVVSDATVDASIPDHVYQFNLAVEWTDDLGVHRNMDFVAYAEKP
ncbi:MAG: prepilin-type N-terminal cleavage/methylation domain-containing protein [Candidatus Zixiibacteriota bacterium]